MSETNKWKFNFLFGLFVRVIVLFWAYLEREMKSSWGRGRRRYAVGCVLKICACVGRACVGLSYYLYRYIWV